MKRKIFASAIFLAAFFGGYLVFNFFSGSTTEERSSKDLAEKYDPLEAESQHEMRVEGEDGFDQPNEFAKLHKMIRTPEGNTEPEYKPNYKFVEFKEAKSRLLKSGNYNQTAEILPWKERGPANVGGRTRGLIVDPADPNHETWFAGSVSGGIWKTTDAGNTWRHLTRELPNLATSEIAMAESNNNVIYAGTGEAFFNLDGVEGSGMFKSTDRGENWFQLEASVNSGINSVNRMVIDPSDEDVVIVAAASGVYKSVDGGASWSRTYSERNNVQQVIANPENFNTLYAAVNGYGVIKSTDAGDSWFAVRNGMQNDGRYEIAMAPQDTALIYASVEASNSELYVTVNGGDEWIKTDESMPLSNWLGAQGWYDNTIAVHPYDKYKVFVGGIDLWEAEVTFDSVKGVTDYQLNGVEEFFSPYPNGLPFYESALGTGIDFWDEDVFEESDLSNIEIRFGPGKSQMAHRFTGSDYTYEDYVEVPFEAWNTETETQLMVSFFDNDGNGEFNVSIFRGENIFVNAVEYDSSNSSSDIAADEGVKHKNIIVWTVRGVSGNTWDPDNLPESSLMINTGPVPVAKSNIQPITDGYNQYGEPDVHVDHHNITTIKKDEANEEFWILNGNDGGVALSRDGGVSWTEPGDNGYNTTQFYGIDKSPNVDRYAGGTQDNGTFISPSGVSADSTTGYDYKLGGDGFEVAWHHKDPNKFIGGSQYNRFWRTTDGGKNWSAANSNFGGWGDNSKSPFVSKIAESNLDPDLLFTLTTDGIYRSDNFAENWYFVPMNQSWGGNNYFSMAQITISEADPQYVWAGAYMGNAGKLHVSVDGGLSFKAVNNYSENFGRVSGLETHPVEDSTAYALFSFANSPKILRTTDLGNSWTDITGFASSDESTNGFPDVAVYSLIVMPFDTDIIWAGTEIGLFVSNDNGESWSYSANGLPAVAIWDMKIVDDQVVVGTHGRGIWTVTLPELSNYEQPDVTLAPRLNSSVQFGDELTLNASLRSVYDSTHVMLGNSVQATVFNDAIVDSTIKVLPTVGGSQKVYLKSYVDGRAYLSAPIQTDVTVDVEDESTMPQKYALSQNYPNPFNPTTTISYSIPERSSVELKIYNSIGEEIAALVNTVKEPGKYTVKWNASGLASGIYFYKITAGEFAESKKMVLLR
jgi:photosystem II stability/assembly factor-like uncharacterized protein